MNENETETAQAATEQSPEDLRNELRKELGIDPDAAGEEYAPEYKSWGEDDRKIVRDTMAHTFGMPEAEADEYIDTLTTLYENMPPLCTDTNGAGKPHNLPVLDTSRRPRDVADTLLTLIGAENVGKVVRGDWTDGVVFRDANDYNHFATLRRTPRGVVKERISKADLMLIAGAVSCPKADGASDGSHSSISRDVKNIMEFSAASMPVPELDRVSNKPVYTRNDDGSIHAATAVGYDATTKTYISVDHGITVPAKPVEAEVEAAWAVFDRFLGAFSYTSDADRDTAYAALLTVLLRNTFHLAPGVLVHANNPGTGKTLLVKIISELTDGKAPKAHQLTLGSGWAMERNLPNNLTANAEAGRTIFFMDEPQASALNAGRPLNVPALNNALTSGELTMRGAYQRGAPEHDIKSITMFLAGNGLRLEAEMARRFVSPSLTKRSGKRFPTTEYELVKAARNGTTKIHWALGVLINNWHAAGMPAPEWTKPSFEEWSEVIGGIMLAAGRGGMNPGVEVAPDDLNIHYGQLLRWIVANVPGRWYGSDEVVREVTAASIRKSLSKAAGDKELLGIIESIAEAAPSKIANQWRTVQRLVLEDKEPSKFVSPLGRVMSSVLATEEKEMGDGEVIRAAKIAHGTRGGQSAGTTYRITEDGGVPLNMRGAHLKS